MITVIIRGGNAPTRRAGCEDAAVDLPVTLSDVQAAADTIGDAVRRTPTSPSETLSAITGAHVWLKFENLQFTGAFKERGARNFLALLAPSERGTRCRGRVGRQPRARGCPPRPPARHRGDDRHARRHTVHEGLEHRAPRRARRARGIRLRRRTRGRGTARRTRPARPSCPRSTIRASSRDREPIGLELLAQTGADTLDAVVVPIGGGGLISGIAVAVKALRPDVRVVGVQAEGYAGMMHALGQAPTPTGGPTIAEGIAVAAPGELTRSIVSELVDDIVVVSEQRIEEAIALGAEIEKTILEGAGAAGLAALLEYPEDVPRPERRRRA